MSDKKDKPNPAAQAENDLLKGLDRLEQIAKGQVTGRLEGKSDKGTWSYNEEPVEPADKDSDVSGDSGEEELDGKKSDTDYKPKNSFKRGHDARANDIKKGDFPDPGKDEDDDAGGDGDRDDGDDRDGPGDGDKDDGEDQFKSLTKGSKAIRQGVEVSPFLRDLVRAIAKSMASAEKRIVRQLSARLDKSFSAQRDFNKSLADAMSGLGAVALEQSDLVKSMAAAPARGVKSQLAAARPIQKSFEGGGADETVTLPDGSTAPQLDKGLLMQRLVNGVAKGLIPPGEVVKFESTGIIHPALYKSLCTDERFAK